MNSKLESGLQKLDLMLSKTQLVQLETYIAMVLEFNKGYNLMKAESEDEMAVNHILDSLAAAPQIKLIAKTLESVHIGDIGSGGGCPGIPLAVTFPEYTFTLVERMEKRVAFLESVISRLALKNVTVLPLQAEKVRPQSFDIAVFRAFHPFDKKTSRTLLALLKTGGFLAAYKARSEKILAEMEDVKDIIPTYEKVPLTVPFLEDHERNLVIVRKQS